MNERLKTAMTARQIGVHEIAQQTEVDPKTVQRWIGGRIPHARHRWAIAKLLNEREDYLWAEENSTGKQTESANQTAEIIAAYGHRADVPTSLWWQMFQKAKVNIDLLGFAMLFLPEQHPDLLPLLESKGAKGCKIRIAVVDPEDSHVKERDDEERLEGTLAARIISTIKYFRAIDGHEGISVGLHHTPLYNSIFRFDDEMFVTPHLYGLHGSKAPLLHLRKLSGKGLYANFAGHFDNVWETVTPLTHFQHVTAK
jgi:transcriptional regulator with XRE-family HTH domain